MAQLVVRNLEDDVKAKLQKRAREHGRSTEEEVRDILRNAVNDERGSRPGLGTEIAALFAGIGLDEEIPEQRGQPVRFPDFKE
jgi:plasmid stability protein